MEFVVGEQHPTWKTFANCPAKQMPVEHTGLSGSSGGDLYPDIVIVNTTRCNLPLCIVEVETPETLTLETTWKWCLDLLCCSILHLYVPEGYPLKTVDLWYRGTCAIPPLAHLPKGIRTYAFDDKGEIRVTCV